MSENNTIKLPEVVVFAGPNGSGKSQYTGAYKIENYIPIYYDSWRNDSDTDPILSIV